MSQKKIKQEKREMKNMRKERGPVGKWPIILVALAVVGGAAYMILQPAQVPKSNITNTAKMKNISNQTQGNTIQPVAKDAKIAVIETAKGIMKIKLYPHDAPKTVANFVSLVEKKFYDGLTFHRVEPGFVIQGGDPKGNGTGGSGVKIPLEIKCADGTMTEGKIATCDPLLKHLNGAVAMARTSDPNSATSQFYITLGAQPSLDKNYAVFGYVVEGLNVASQIKKGDVMKRIYLENQ